MSTSVIPLHQLLIQALPEDFGPAASLICQMHEDLSGAAETINELGEIAGKYDELAEQAAKYEEERDEALGALEAAAAEHEKLMAELQKTEQLRVEAVTREMDAKADKNANDFKLMGVVKDLEQLRTRHEETLKAFSMANESVAALKDKVKELEDGQHLKLWQDTAKKFEDAYKKFEDAYKQAAARANQKAMEADEMRAKAQALEIAHNDLQDDHNVALATVEQLKRELAEVK